MILTQPRKTLCYGVSYLYSNSRHVLQINTPSDIQTLMNITNEMYKNYDLSQTMTMCLSNKYQTGRHYISKHSDKEFQVSHIRDVICWVTGKSRKLIIRSRKPSTKILEITIPEGIYIMKGDYFQRR
jgi:hypothetical protein